MAVGKRSRGMANSLDGNVGESYMEWSRQTVKVAGE
jgi:hypothetical protein